MKNLLFLVLFLPFIGNAQVDKEKVRLSPGLQDSLLGTSIILKDNAIIFQKIYESPLGKSDLIKKINAFLPTVKSFQLTSETNQTTDQFSGRLSDFIVNYRKFGGTYMSTSTILNYPLNANVIIQVKDNKYRVIISDIKFKYNPGTNSSAYTMEFDDMISKNKRSKIRNGETYVKSAKYVNDDFESAFDIIKNNKVSDNF